MRPMRSMWIISMPDNIATADLKDLKPGIGLARRLIRR